MKAKRIVSVIVASSMLLSLTACSSKTDKAVVAAAEEFADAVLSLDAGDICDLSVDGDDFEDDLTFELDFESLYGENTAEVFEAIVDATTYEIDEKSVDSDSDEGEIDVIFTMPDYEAVADDEDNMSDPETFIDALEDADTIEITVTLEFENDDEWLVANTQKVISKVFAFTTSGIHFGPNLVEAFESYSWYNSDWDYENQYTNADYINFWGRFSDEVSSSDINIYFEVERDGTLIYTSDIVHSGDFYYRASMDPDSVEGMLPAGVYTITCYTEDGTVIESGTCTVLLEEAGVSSTRWYYDDGTGADGLVYYQDTTIIDLDVSVNEYVESYYTILYNGTLVYESSVDYHSTIMGYYDENHCGTNTLLESNGYLPTGRYTISFYLADGTELYTEDCNVINTEFPNGMSIGGAGEDGRGTDEVVPHLYGAELEWYFEDSIDDETNDVAYYSNTNLIDCDCSMSETVNCCYMVAYSADPSTFAQSAETVYLSDFEDASTVAGYYGTTQGAELNEDGYLPDGMYAIYFIDSNQEIISFGIAMVSND